MTGSPCDSVRARLAAAGPESLAEGERAHLLGCDACFAAFEAACALPIGALLAAAPDARPLPAYPRAALAAARAAEARAPLARLRLLLRRAVPALRPALALATLLLLLALPLAPPTPPEAPPRLADEPIRFPLPDGFALAPRLPDDGAEDGTPATWEIDRLAPELRNGNGHPLVSLVPVATAGPTEVLSLVPDLSEEPMSL